MGYAIAMVSVAVADFQVIGPYLNV